MGRPVTGYRPLTKLLHWATVAAIAVQFAIGYLTDADDGAGRGRGRGRSGESGRGRGRGRGGEYDLADVLLRAHVTLGVVILLLGVARLAWRRRAGLPPWAPQLTARQRTLAHWVERGLYTSLFGIPLTGMWLVLVSDEALPLHVAAHLVFFVALAAHLGLVFSRRLLPRML